MKGSMEESGAHSERFDEELQVTGLLSNTTSSSHRRLENWKHIAAHHVMMEKESLLTDFSV